MIEEPAHSERNFCSEAEKSSPVKSEDTRDCWPGLQHYYLPVPLLVFFPAPTTFFSYSTGATSPQFGLVCPDYGPAPSAPHTAGVKIEMDEQINFIRNSEGEHGPHESPGERHDYNQNEFRNVMPNLVRLFLNFALIREKSGEHLERAFPGLGEEQANLYYKYCRRLRTKGCLGKNAYISEKKLKDILGLSDSQYFGSRCVRPRTAQEQLCKRIMRTLALYYLNTLCVGQILHSPKIKKELKMVHLSRRNRLISILRRAGGQRDLHHHKIWILLASGARRHPEIKWNILEDTPNRRVTGERAAHKWQTRCPESSGMWPGILFCRPATFEQPWPGSKPLEPGQ